jgi:hypothetical protein
LSYDFETRTQIGIYLKYLMILKQRAQIGLYLKCQEVPDRDIFRMSDDSETEGPDRDIFEICLVILK